MSKSLKYSAGQKVLNYIILGRAENYISPSGYIKTKWKCKCLECGVEKEITTSDLSRQRNKCMHKVKRAKKTKHPDYKLWVGMKQRCNNPNTARYKNYGGRGIKVCDRWLNSFQAFVQDMGPRPSAQHTIERINTNGNYEPTNCKWVLNKLQGRTRSTTLLNEQLVRYIRQQRDSGAFLSDTAKELGINRNTVASVWYDINWKDVA